MVPGRNPALDLEHLVVDFNGTLALDGRLITGVAGRLKRVARLLDVAVLTTDTFGTARRALAGLPVAVRIVRAGAQKRRFVESLGPKHVVVVGNGNNDLPMFKAAALGIAVLGVEGTTGRLLQVATLVTRDAKEALDLLLSPRRLVATLRE